MNIAQRILVVLACLVCAFMLLRVPWIVDLKDSAPCLAGTAWVWSGVECSENGQRYRTGRVNFQILGCKLGAVLFIASGFFFLLQSRRRP